MSELSKTAIFVAVAAVLGLTAWLTGPSSPTVETAGMFGQPLDADFTDPRKAASLQIVTFEGQEARTLEVVGQGDDMTVASHENYPGDDTTKRRAKQIKEELAGLKIVGLVSVPGYEQENEDSEAPRDTREIHKFYGVIDPQGEAQSSSTAEEVGTRVTVADKDGNVLCSLVIGKKVKYQPKQQPAPGQEMEPPGDLYYVRHAGQKPVFTVAMDTNQLTTKLDDWISSDLLDFSLFDLEYVKIRDYRLTEEMLPVLPPQIRLVYDFGSEFSLDYDSDADTKWTAAELMLPDPQGALAPAELADDEELNTEKLEDLKSGLSWMKFVNIARKPAGLSEQLKETGKVSQQLTAEAQQSMQEYGFYAMPQRDAEGKPILDQQGQPLVKIDSYHGELQVGLKDGLEISLRFGKTAGTAESNDKDAADKDAADKDAANENAADENAAEEDTADSKGPGHNRYVLVTAAFNADLIPQPELDPLPDEDPQPDEGNATEEETEETTEEATDSGDGTGGEPGDDGEAGDVGADNTGSDATAENAAAEDTAAEDTAAEDTAAEDTAAEDTAAEDTAAEDTAAEDTAAEDTAAEDTAAEDTAAEDTAGEDTAAEDTAAEDTAAEDTAAEDTAAEDTAAEDTAGEASENGDSQSDDAPKEKTEREKVEEENQRKLDDYDDKIKKGQERAVELNARFADWYYIISSDVYTKIHLGRDQIVKQKEEEESEEEGSDVTDHSGHDHALEGDSAHDHADETIADGDGADETSTDGDGAQQGDAHSEHGEEAAEEKPAEPTGKVSEFEKLKQEGPDGSE